MKEIEVVRLQGRGLGIIVKGIRSKREREYIIDKIIRASSGYRMLYKLRKSLGL
jgi:hypothetical protein